MHNLKPAGLPPDKLAQLRDEAHQFDRRRERRVAGGEMQSLPILTPRIAAISRRHLGGGQHAAMAGLGALADLDLDHLDLRRSVAVTANLFGRERAIGVAAAEIAGADLPDDVAAFSR